MPFTTKKLNTAEIEALKEETRQDLPAGSVVYTILRSVSRSGMSRVISVVTVNGGDVRQFDYTLEQMLGYKMAPDTGVKVAGCGMDMGFHLVYTLSQALYGDGYALKQRWL